MKIEQTQQIPDYLVETIRKIRLIVEVATETGKPTRYAIPFPENSTIADLSIEIARRATPQNPVQFSLSLSDSAILCPEDLVGDVIKPNEVIYAHVQGSTPERETSRQAITWPSVPLPSLHNPDISMSDDTQAAGKRVRIALVTPELARNEGKGESLKKFAFEGSFVSVKLTMDVVRHQIARSIGWPGGEAPEVVDDSDKSKNSDRERIIPRGTCSCVIGNQLLQEGRHEQFHCKKEINGRTCEDIDCSYSHVSISSGIAGLRCDTKEIECKICEISLHDYCEKCLNSMARAPQPLPKSPNLSGNYSVRCPLVQNAGCGHIFHAHCYFKKMLPSHTLGCPAGCPAESISVEAVPFGFPEPHILVVHSGCVVDRITVPEIFLTFNGSIVMSDIQMVSLLSEKYKNFGPGLTVTMYGRKNTGRIMFRHSTIVSICCSLRHSDFDGIVRFELNGPLPSQIKDARLTMDLHTAVSPLYNEDPKETLESLGLDDGVEDGGEITLYVVKRHEDYRTGEGQKYKGKAAVFMLQEDWQPTVRQSERGMAAFLSGLLVFAHYLSLGHKENQDSRKVLERIAVHLLSLTQFPPAVRALFILSRNESITPEEARALSETMYHLCLDISHPLITKGDTSKTFEGARLLFGMIVERSKGPFTLSRLDRTPITTQDLFHDVSLTCELSGEPLRNPVQYNGRVVEHGLALLKGAGGPLFDDRSKNESITPTSATLPGFIKRSMRRTKRLVIFNASVAIPRVLVPKLTPNSLDMVIAMANVEFPIHAPLTMKKDAITPALTLDEGGYNAVYLSTGEPCGPADINAVIFKPCNGGESGIDTNVLAMKLEPIIKKRKAANDWDVDAFTGTRSDKVDTREIEEAIVLCLDLSSSMNDRFNADEDSEDKYEDEPSDPDETALEDATASFEESGLDTKSDAVELAKTLIDSLDCLPNIARYIDSQSTPFLIGRLNRATTVLEELSIIFRRVRRQDIQHDNHPRIHTTWEGFIVAISSPVSSETLAKYLLERCEQAKYNSGNPMSNGVPKRLCDPLTGKLFMDPVKGDDGQMYERSSLKAWWDKYHTWPANPNLQFPRSSTDIHRLPPDVETAQDVQDVLAGRPRPVTSCTDPAALITLTGLTDHERTYVTLPGSSSVLSIYFDVWSFLGIFPSDCSLFQGIRDTGDRHLMGTLLGPTSRHSRMYCKQVEIGPLTLPAAEIYVSDWHYEPEGAEKIRRDSRKLSRLDIVKQAFEAFVNKSEAFDHPIAIGLVTFGRDVQEVQPLTLLKERFRNSMRAVTAAGDTPLFDSLAMAESMLVTFKKEHPQTKLRIMCLTDGYDIGSTTRPEVITARLQRSKIVVDSMSVQSYIDQNKVHCISVATGGYSFEVNTLETALKIVELETVLRSKDRLERKAKPIVRSVVQFAKYQDIFEYPVDIISSEECPGRKPHARLSELLLPAEKAATRFVPSTNRQKRLMQEIRQVVITPHPAIDVYSGDDLSFWKIVIEAPEDTPYAGGTFLAYVDFGSEYPQVAPEVRFITTILHPNINRHGKVCHAALDRSWLADMSMITILQIIYSLLLTPDSDNPLDLHAAMEYNDDTGQHALKVHEMVKKFASKSRAAWRKEMGG